jgi:hypothetical protein
MCQPERVGAPKASGDLYVVTNVTKHLSLSETTSYQRRLAFNLEAAFITTPSKTYYVKEHHLDQQCF